MSDVPLGDPARESDASRQAGTGKTLLLRLVRQLVEEQRNCWHCGERKLAESFLARYPDLLGDREALLDFLYYEIVLREEHGEAPRLEEYLARFPRLAGALRDQFEVH
jgi:hypothetical protein